MSRDWIKLCILYTFLLAGCGGSSTGSVVGSVAPQVVNKLDMYGTINGSPFEGVGVVPASAKYDMKIQSDSDINLLTVQTCHRNFSAPDVIKTGWFENNRGYNYIFQPAPGIEDVGSCLIRVGSYNAKEKTQNAWAVVDIITDDMQLPALNICDGSRGKSHGVSMCQTKNGLIERLVFDVDIVVDLAALSSNCTGKILPDGKTWEYQMGLGECVVIFMEKAKPHRRHRHTTEGYNNVIYRGGS